MADLIRKRKAPHGALCPQRIETKGLFALDVDDNIWQDIGLEDSVTGTAPPWLADEE
ncbi:hypothetical protein C0991_009696, partial [Blastosporella zonata]